MEDREDISRFSGREGEIGRTWCSQVEGGVGRTWLSQVEGGGRPRANQGQPILPQS